MIDNPKPFAPLFLKSSMLCSIEPVHRIAYVKVVVVQRIDLGRTFYPRCLAVELTRSINLILSL